MTAVKAYFTSKFPYFIIIKQQFCSKIRKQQCTSTHQSQQNFLFQRGHECKATHRLSAGIFFRFGPCRSRKRFRPKYCGQCPIPDIQCEPTLSTTVKVEFLCDGPQPNEVSSELLPEYLEPGEDMWIDTSTPALPIDRETIMVVSVQWVLKCRCETVTNEPTSSTGEVILHRVHRTAAP